MKFKSDDFNTKWMFNINVHKKKVTSISFEFNDKSFKIPIEDVFKMFDKYRVEG